VKRSGIVLCCVLVIAAFAFGMMIYSMITWGLDRDKRVAESWRQFDQRMTQAGCKITSYVPAGSWVRPVWMCPDGHVEIGRAE